VTVSHALLSVSDKTGLVEFARALVANGVVLLSTGGTLRALVEANVPATSVEEYTGSPEVMGGRVKTLHPRVHGGILARTGIDDDDLTRLGAELIDLVVVNLYPFEQTRKRPGSTHEEIVENIDIGGPSMVRSAAKNHHRVTVVCDPGDYERVAEALRSNHEVPLSLREELAAKAFAHTAAYDGAIASYLSSRSPDSSTSSVPVYPQYLTLAMELAYPLRYGENPHQSGAFYRFRDAADGCLARADSLGVGGKELSFNNLVDAHAALEAVREFSLPAAVIVKHTNPCGVACSDFIQEAFHRARGADAVSAFGGIVALNRPVDVVTARALSETFFECVLAPSFDADALAILREKKNLRLLATGKPNAPESFDIKRISGGVVVQSWDTSAAGEVENATTATAREPSAEERQSLSFAWRVCKHVKSNAIVLARGQQTCGVGAGQMSRVQSVKIACEKAGSLAQGSVLASDAFFPFADGVEEALAHGVTAFVQPGGSVRDQDVIDAVNRAGATMLFTKVRHFRH